MAVSHSIRRCSVPQCTRHAITRGYCRLHYRRLLKTGSVYCGKTGIRIDELVLPQIPGVQIRHIPGFPGYAADSEGRIWSFSKNSHRKHGIKIGDWYSLTPQLNHGYLRLVIAGTNIGVHRLVLLAFKGPGEMGQECCHFPDYTRTNNRPDNLRWGTRKDNMRDMKTHGRGNSFPRVNGERCWNAKMTADRVRAMRDEFASGGITKDALGMKYGISRTQTCSIIARRSWKHI